VKKAIELAERIANHPDSGDPVNEHHLGEAQAIALALRAEYQDDLLLLDELAARAIAKEEGIKLSGFPGVLLLAVRGELMPAEELRVRLEECREQGTHYSASFVQEVYRMAKHEWRPD
jgi:predicted nucleic acid-binding protein